MKVVSIEAAKDSKYYLVTTDNKSMFQITPEVLLKLGLRIGQDITSSEIQDIKNQSKNERLYNSCLNLISSRLKTKYEVSKYLERKGASEELASNIISKLIEIGLIDDRKYIVSFIHDQQLTKPASKLKLTSALIKKGISKSDIDNFFNEHPVDELESLRKLVEVKRRQLKYQDDLKLTAYLVRSGFSYSDVKEVLS